MAVIVCSWQGCSTRTGAEHHASVCFFTARDLRFIRLLDTNSVSVGGRVADPAVSRPLVGIEAGIAAVLGGAFVQCAGISAFRAVRERIGFLEVKTGSDPRPR